MDCQLSWLQLHGLLRLTLTVLSVGAAGETDAMLAHCGSICTLTLTGNPIPCILPLFVQNLYVST